MPGRVLQYRQLRELINPFKQRKRETMSIEYFEIMGDNLEDLREWAEYEADMATDPFQDEDWADRMEHDLG